MFKKSEFLVISKDRTAIILLILGALGSVVLIVAALLKLHISDVQVPIRYSDYGITNLYRDKWYSLLDFPIFGFITLLVNSFLAVKLYGHSEFLARCFMIFNIIVVIFGLFVTFAVFRLAAFSA